MKSYYIAEHDAFVRYFDIPAADGQENLPVRVFLSGLSSSVIAAMLNIATHPAVRGRRTLLIDYIGSGCSDKSAQFDHALPHHADYIARILDHEGLSGCEIIGHSMGGTIALYLAMQCPEQVSQLLIAESNLAPGGGPGSRYIAGFSEDDWVRTQHPAYMQTLWQRARDGNPGSAMVYGSWEASDPLAIHRQSRALVDIPEDFFGQIIALPQPVTFIYGDANLPANNDGKIFPDSPDPHTLTNNGIRVGVVENSGHLMMVDNPDGFAREIATALTDID